MMILAATLLLANGAAAAMPPDGASGQGAAVCQSTRPQSVDDRDRPDPHRLGREPRANQIQAVVWSEQGCVKPRVVREDVGQAPGF